MRIVAAKNIFLIFVITIFCLGGCSSNPKKIILGVWEYNGYEYTDKVTVVLEVKPNNTFTAKRRTGQNEKFEDMGNGQWKFYDNFQKVEFGLKGKLLIGRLNTKEKMLILNDFVFKKQEGK